MGFVFCKAQQNFYIIFQAKNKAPFFIKYKSSVISSSSNGLLIMPKLTNGEHNIKIGFPKSDRAEKLFKLLINNKDEYIELGASDDGIARLTNVANGEEVGMVATVVVAPTKPIEPAVTIQEPIAKPKVDSPIVKVEPKVPDPVIAAPIVKEPVVINEPAIKSPDPIKRIVNTSTVQRVIEQKDLNDNFTLVKYVVEYDGKFDTISVEYPKQKVAKGDDSKTTEPVAPEIKDVKKEEPIVKTEPTIDLKPIDDRPAEKPIALINSDCIKIATEDDYAVLRKKMASVTSAQKMDDIAFKAFKKKCYTTVYIKKLMGLYETDMEKVNFLTKVYPFTLDTGNFKALINELRNEEAIGVFKEKIIR